MSVLNSENTIDRIIGFWQTEDLLRAYRFDVDKIFRKQFAEDGRNEEAKAFLIELKSSMEKQDVVEHGHTHHSMELIEEKENKHGELLELDLEYANHFEKIKNPIKAYNQQQPTPMSAVAVLFELLYAYYLKRIAGDELNETVATMAESAGFCLNKLYG